jgi:hypothetical protein
VKRNYRDDETCDNSVGQGVKNSNISLKHGEACGFENDGEILGS